MSVFHLKYRPQKLADLDLEEVSDKLKKILSSDDIPQSYLFSGPKGAGKTSAARIVAKVVNCEGKTKGEACNECENCKEIQNGSNIDVLEIDAASNRGIEDIRALKDKAYLLPTRLKRKVFIIDEVHMLTKEAFNALLKLIEEPPKHTFFILCTTDPGKIPETVLSRLIRVDFHKGNQKQLIKSLNRSIDGEGLKVEEKVKKMLVAKSDGSFRNLQKMFNELVMDLGNDLSEERVLAYIATKTGEYSEEDLETDLVEGEVKTILEKMEKMANIGVDFKAYRERLVVYFQKKLLANLGVGSEDGSKMRVEMLDRWLNLLIAAGKQEKDCPVDQLPLELAVVELLKKSTGNTEVIVVEKPPETKIEFKEPEPVGRADGVDLPVEKMMEDWGNLLVTIKAYNHSIEAFLRSARPKSIVKGLFTLEVFYPFHKDKLEEQKNREIIEKVLKKVYGADLILRCVIGKNKMEPLTIKNDTPMEKVSEVLMEEQKSEAKKDDIYDVAKEIFG